MSDWTKELMTTTAVSTLPDSSERAKAKGKPGPKKSTVKRKVVGLNFSDTQNKKLTNLEMQLKLAGVELPRGRSEAAELAINLLSGILDPSFDPGQRAWALGFISSVQGLEEKQNEEDGNN